MADLVVTATAVVQGANTPTKRGTLGETVTAGQAVYLKTADQLIYKADANVTAAEAVVVGIALNGGVAGQRVAYQTGGRITIGATTNVGTVYMLSATAGGICPYADLVGTDRTTRIGWAPTNATLDINILPTGLLFVPTGA